ncbi:hypothetical protein [Clostridium hydrogenum]|uniref:hypothetical protein n=1 Tax=Clostridium hydrogenum TaxID=2855764 RepID=UPI001F1A32ED|nr:hypothetical protein [Clostridium hydrogenum]
MEIKYQISRDDLINFHMKHFIETKAYKRSTIIQAISILIFAIFTCIIINHLYYYIMLLLTLLILTVYRKRRIKFLLRKKLNKVFLSVKYNDCFKPTKIIITEVGLQTITSLSEKIYKWQSIKIISLIDNYIFIITAANDELFIPISAFKGYNDKKLFLNKLIENSNLKISYKYPIDAKYQ